MADLYRAAVSIARLENETRRVSPVHGLSAPVKMAAAFMFVAAVVSLPIVPAQCALFIIFPAAVTAVSGVSAGLLAKRLGVALPFSLMAGLNRLLTDSGSVMILGHFTVGAGVLSCAAILLKTLLTVWALLLLAAVTPLPEITRVFSTCGLPADFCRTVDFIGRYTLALLEEMAAMHTAYRLRAGVRGKLRITHAGILLGRLFLRSLDRAERIYRAMRCRGYTGIYGGAKKTLTASDYVCIALSAAVIGLTRVAAGVLL